jgi:hypothetical protein
MFSINSWPKFLNSLAIITIAAQFSYACTCALPTGSMKKQLAEAKHEAEAIFSGRVIEVLRIDGGLRQRVRIAVEQVWKGKAEPEVIIYTGGGGGDCGYRFESGMSNLVYCDATKEGELWTNICTRTQALKSAARDLRYLGRATKVMAKKAA